MHAQGKPNYFGLLRLDIIEFKLGFSPIVHAAERLFTGHVIHQDEPHGPPVIGSGDGPIPLLPRCVLRSS